MKNQNTKLIVMLSLIVAVVGLTLGFAAFSNQLKISSSATVTPDAKDFKIGVYVLDENIDIDAGDYLRYVVNPDNYILSDIGGVIYGDDATADMANMRVINNNESASISIDLKITKPNYRFRFMVMLKNEGLYDAYLDPSNLLKLGHNCIAEDDTRQDLVDAACKNIDYWVEAYTGIDEQNHLTHVKLDENNKIKLAMNQTIFARMSIDSINSLAGRHFGVKFAVTFDDIVLKFSTAA